MAGLIPPQSGFPSPRTVLGFYAAVLVILEAGVVGTVGILAAHTGLAYLVPWVLGFAALVLVALIVVVVLMNWLAPAKLQLSPMTGGEYLDWMRLTLGDSTTGEKVVNVAVPRGFADSGTIPDSSDSNDPEGS